MKVAFRILYSNNIPPYFLLLMQQNHVLFYNTLIQLGDQNIKLSISYFPLIWASSLSLPKNCVHFVKNVCPHNAINIIVLYYVIVWE